MINNNFKINVWLPKNQNSNKYFFYIKTSLIISFLFVLFFIKIIPFSNIILGLLLILLLISFNLEYIFFEKYESKGFIVFTDQTVKIINNKEEDEMELKYNDVTKIIFILGRSSDFTMSWISPKGYENIIIIILKGKIIKYNLYCDQNDYMKIRKFYKGIKQNNDVFKISNSYIMLLFHRILLKIKGNVLN